MFTPKEKTLKELRLVWVAPTGDRIAWVKARFESTEPS
jgi:hypothetical protein